MGDGLDQAIEELAANVRQYEQNLRQYEQQFDGQRNLLNRIKEQMAEIINRRHEGPIRCATAVLDHLRAVQEEAAQAAIARANAAEAENVPRPEAAVNPRLLP